MVQWGSPCTLIRCWGDDRSIQTVLLPLESFLQILQHTNEKAKHTITDDFLFLCLSVFVLFIYYPKLNFREKIFTVYNYHSLKLLCYHMKYGLHAALPYFEYNTAPRQDPFVPKSFVWDQYVLLIVITAIINHLWN